jgi:hypothetical protein
MIPIVGLFGKLKDGVVRKLDGPPEPPAHVWPADRAWARLVTSSRGSGGAPHQIDESPSMLDDVIGKARGVTYRFELEVHRPAQAVYTISRVGRVPAKVEGTLFLESTPVPAGAEVPLRVTGPTEEDVELDWDAYLAIPDQADRVYHLRAKAQRATIAQNVSPQVREQGAQAVMMLAQGVVQGTVTRDVFDQQVEDLRGLGYLTDESYQAALAVIESTA